MIKHYRSTFSLSDVIAYVNSDMEHLTEKYTPIQMCKEEHIAGTHKLFCITVLFQKNTEN